MASALLKQDTNSTLPFIYGTSVSSRPRAGLSRASVVSLSASSKPKPEFLNLQSETRDFATWFPKITFVNLVQDTAQIAIEDISDCFASSFVSNTRLDYLPFLTMDSAAYFFRRYTKANEPTVVSKKKMALELLSSWLEPTSDEDIAEQRISLAETKIDIDNNRLSSRKFF